MKNALGIMFVILLLAIAFQMVGCAGALTLENAVTTIDLADDIAHKVKDLHDIGVDQRVLDDVHAIIADVHKEISMLHGEHAGEK